MSRRWIEEEETCGGPEDEALTRQDNGETGSRDEEVCSLGNDYVEGTCLVDYEEDEKENEKGRRKEEKQKLQTVKQKLQAEKQTLTEECRLDTGCVRSRRRCVDDYEEREHEEKRGLTEEECLTLENSNVDLEKERVDEFDKEGEAEEKGRLREEKRQLEQDRFDHAYVARQCLGDLGDLEEEETEETQRNPLHHIVVFVAVLCALGFVEGISVNGLPFINISSLEKRFELTSKDAGTITSSADIGAIMLVLLVSYYGGRSHRPRVTASGAFMLSVGALIFLIPHALVGLYSFGSESSKFTLCKSSQLSTLDHCTASKGDKSASRFLPMFIVGQAVQGIGFTPVFTCGFAYIDDHATTESTAVFIGITYAITALGVGMGYVVGGQLLSLWVDVGRMDTSTITITPEDRRWVGAWWIGYVICSILYFIIAVILCFFPRHLPGAKSQANNKDGVSRARSSRSHHQKNIIEIILSFPKAIFTLVCNPLYVLLVLVGAGDTLIVSGIAGFAPKIIEEKFKVKPSEAGLIMGAVSLVGGAGGMGLGGYLIRRFHVKLFGILKMCLFFTAVASVTGGAAFFISCPKDAFAGISSQYGSKSTSNPPSSVNLNATCNSNCACTTRNFDPVCGQDGVTYFSACYAGCMSDNTTTKLLLKYDNCSCVSKTMLSSGDDGTGIANGGTCSSACPQVWPFVIVLFFGILFTFLNVTPISIAILRCVPDEERSVALGMQWVALRSMGTIPGPILTGIVLDSACRLWQSTCNGRGSCWMYDSHKMSLNLFFWWVGVKVATFGFLGLAYLYYKKKGHAEVDRQEQISLSIYLSPNVSVRKDKEDKDDLSAVSSSFGQASTCVDAGFGAKKDDDNAKKYNEDATGDVDKTPDAVSRESNFVQPAVAEPLKLD